ncbi:MAG: DedA family protein [Gemmataceae bacterium]|nr:DedA family protein [Gemmataceae bacterium]
MQAFIHDWGYLGVFLGILATGLGFPMPEELPVVVGGALSGGNEDKLRWYIMLPICIVGVIVGDLFLYGIGRLWGPKLTRMSFVRKRILPPERLKSITENFHKYGVKILLFARLTPGIRAPIFMTAGITKLSPIRFMVADGIYAIPGVSLLFGLGYFFTERMVDIIQQEAGRIKSIVILVGLVAVAGYFTYRFLRKPVVTGSPGEMPQICEPVSQTIDTVTSPIIHPEQAKPVEDPEILPPAETPPAESTHVGS